MEKIKEMIRSGHLDQYLSFQSMPLPIDPEITVTELKRKVTYIYMSISTTTHSCTADVYIFKSAMAPIKIDFQTTTDAYSVSYKYQLIERILTLY